jgi:hypothetical protein
MLRFVEEPPGQVIATLAPRNGEATVERIATNAVMAGCRPEYMPVIVTAVRAVAEPAFNLNGMQSTTHPCAVFVLVNGPIGRELSINSGHNCFGQGRRANAAIGRAMRLVLQNIGGGTPGEGDKATQGTPAKYTYCIAENEAANPWEPLHVEQGFAPEDSTVTVAAAEGPHNIQEHFSTTGLSILQTMAGALRQSGSNNIGFRRGTPFVVFGPEHAETVARDGYSKEDVKRFLWEHSKLMAADWPSDWRKEPHFASQLLDDFGHQDWTAVCMRPSDLYVIVAGGAGKHSCWLPTVATVSSNVMRRIERADGTALRSVYEIGRA